MHKKINSTSHNIICKIDEFSYNKHPVLKNVDIIISNDTITGLVGDNGMGKSTLIHLLSDAIERPKNIVFKHSFNRVMCTFQSPAILKRSVWDNVMHTINALKLDNKECRVKEALKAVDLLTKQDLSAPRLSGGQKMRLQIARLIASDADLWLLDEPFSSLDNSSTYRLINILKKYSKCKIKIILSSHNVAVMREICDDICLFDNNTIRKPIKAKSYFK